MSVSRTGEAPMPSKSVAERLQSVGFEMMTAHRTRELVRSDEPVAAVLMLRGSNGNGHGAWIDALSSTIGTRGADETLTRLLSSKRREFLGLLDEARMGVVYPEQRTAVYARRFREVLGPDVSAGAQEFLDHLSEYLELCRGIA